MIVFHLFEECIIKFSTEIPELNTLSQGKARFLCSSKEFQL